jgi:hypothetical protein
MFCLTALLFAAGNTTMPFVFPIAVSRLRVPIALRAL